MLEEVVGKCADVMRVRRGLVDSLRNLRGFRPSHQSRSMKCWLTFAEEIYDESGNFRQIHRKYPVDLGHQEIGSDE